jgi:hypothetical protein
MDVHHALKLLEPSVSNSFLERILSHVELLERQKPPLKPQDRDMEIFEVVDQVRQDIYSLAKPSG